MGDGETVRDCPEHVEVDLVLLRATILAVMTSQVQAQVLQPEGPWWNKCAKPTW